MTTKQMTWANIVHMALQGFIWLAPMLILSIPPQIGSMTVSGILSACVAWLSHRYVAGATLAGVSAGGLKRNTD